MKRCVRHWMDHVAQAAGLLGRWEREAREGLTLLMYHRVLPDEQCDAYPLANLVVSASVFERQMEWLSGHCSVLPVAQAISRIGTRDGGKPLVSITFDDGYADNAEVAAPIMENHGLLGTFFLTTSFVEAGTLLWHDLAGIHWQQSGPAALVNAARSVCSVGEEEGRDWEDIEAFVAFIRHAEPRQRRSILNRLNELRPPRIDRGLFAPMAIEAAQRLADRGHEIASHTVSHAPLRQLGDEQVMGELAESKQALEGWIGRPVAGVSYPNGDCDGRIAGLTERVGYAYGCTTRRGLNVIQSDRYQLRRRAVFPSSVTGPSWRHSDIAYRAEVMGLHDWLRRVA